MGVSSTWLAGVGVVVLVGVPVAASGRCPDSSGAGDAVADVGEAVAAAQTISVLPPQEGAGVTAADVQRILDDAISQVPPCILNAGPAGPIQFTVPGDPGMTNAAYYRPVRRDDGWSSPRVVLGLGHFLPSYRDDIAAIYCSDPDSLARLIPEPVAYTVLHESLHHLHRAGNPAAVDAFLAVRYADAVRDYQDHRYPRLYEMQPAVMGQLDLDSGSEYFAISIQTYVTDPETFCTTLTDAERQILRENFGDCLDQIPRDTPLPSCW